MEFLRLGNGGALRLQRIQDATGQAFDFVHQPTRRWAGVDWRVVRPLLAAGSGCSVGAEYGGAAACRGVNDRRVNNGRLGRWRLNDGSTGSRQIARIDVDDVVQQPELRDRTQPDTKAEIGQPESRCTSARHGGPSHQLPDALRPKTSSGRMYGPLPTQFERPPPPQVPLSYQPHSAIRDSRARCGAERLADVVHPLLEALTGQLRHVLALVRSLTGDAALVDRRGATAKILTWVLARQAVLTRRAEVSAAALSMTLVVGAANMLHCGAHAGWGHLGRPCYDLELTRC